MNPSMKKDLPIALSIQRKNKRKKMADGGDPKPSPSPSNTPSAGDQTLADTGKSDAGKAFMNSFQNAKAYGGEIENDFKSEGKVSVDSLNDEEMAMIHEHRMKKRSEVDVDANQEGMTNVDKSKDGEDVNMLAKGGMAKKMPPKAGSKKPSIDDEMDMSDEQHPESVADAIMMKRKKMADGGHVDLEDNAIESGNDADSMNEKALGKEDYSEQDGLDSLDAPMSSGQHGDDSLEADVHDMVSKIRSKIRSRI